MEIAQDYEAIKRYAGDEMAYAAAVRLAGKRADMVERPEIPIEFVGWLRYLRRRQKVMEMPAFAGMTLRADVAHGLEALEEARAEFRANHKQCPRCGNWLAIYASGCVCGEKL